MNKTFCTNLNLSIPVFTNPLDLETLGTESFHRRATNLTSDIYNLFNKLNLEIRLAEIFYIPKHGQIRIHEDGGEQNDVLKVNWVFGGQDSLMHWYNPVNDPVWKKTALGVAYKMYLEDQVEVIHSQRVGCPSLVQVGIPHNVVTNNFPRLCLSVLPVSKTTFQYLTFEEGLDTFSSFLVEDQGIEPL